MQNGAAVDGGRVDVPAPLQNADANGPKVRKRGRKLLMESTNEDHK